MNKKDNKTFKQKLSIIWRTIRNIHIPIEEHRDYSNRIDTTIKICESSFKSKLELIQYDQYMKGITHDNHSNYIQIAKMPISDERTSMHPNYEVYQLEKEIIHCAFTSHKVNVEHIKHEVARKLALKLIDLKYINTRLVENEIIFEINTYQ